MARLGDFRLSPIVFLIAGPGARFFSVFIECPNGRVFPGDWHSFIPVAVRF